MNHSFFKISVSIGLITAVLVSLYQLSDMLLIYHYFKFEYYIAAVAMTALFAGIILAKKHCSSKLSPSNSKSPVSELTNKEFQVLVMISEGKSNKEIATLNFVELSTVKTHINNIYTKLGVNSRKRAVEIYRQYLSRQKSTFSPPVTI